jgi:hypothetical protein
VPPLHPGRVAYANLGFAEDALAPVDFAGALRSSLRPGTWVVRYGKRWYMAQSQDAGDRWIDGRLAFESATEDPMGIWDPEQNDIRPMDTVGKPVHSLDYVIDVRSQRVAFELRSQHVRPGTFQHNFQALLAKASNLPWRVILDGVDQPPFEEWVTGLDRLTQIWITMYPPNPHSPSEEINEVFDSAKASAATLRVEGDMVELSNAELIQASIAHARTYGKISAKGVDAKTQKQTEWATKTEESGVVIDAAPRDPATRRVSSRMLRSLLNRRSKGK